MNDSIVWAHAGEEALPIFLPLVALVMFVLWTRKRITKRDATPERQDELSAPPGSIEEDGENAEKDF